MASASKPTEKETETLPSSDSDNRSQLIQELNKENIKNDEAIELETNNTQYFVFLDAAHDNRDGKLFPIYRLIFYQQISENSKRFQLPNLILLPNKPVY